ncbi:MAG: helix-turn-helix domain-containing protein [Candidatus Thorarchaeota archaeon]
MPPKKAEMEKSSSDKLDEILSSVIELRSYINNLDYRISRLEDHFDRSLSVSSKTGILKSSEENMDHADFEKLDEHLKRTYKTLAEAQEPLTASDVAERMGRSRSTTSYHLNKLEKMGILVKFPSPSKESSRTVLFSLKDETF